MDTDGNTSQTSSSYSFVYGTGPDDHRGVDEFGQLLEQCGELAEGASRHGLAGGLGDGSYLVQPSAERPTLPPVADVDVPRRTTKVRLVPGGGGDAGMLPEPL